MTMILPLTHITEQDKPIVGEQLYTLSLLAKKYPVPSGFVISAAACDLFFQATGIEEKRNSYKKNAVLLSEEEKDATIAELQLVIKEAAFPPDLLQQLEQFSYSLQGPYVIMGFSLLQHKPFSKEIHLIGNSKQFFPALRSLWSLLCTQEILDLPEEEQHQNIVLFVFPLMESSACGILETSYKMNPDEVLIQCCKGLPQGLFDSHILLDRYFITKKTLRTAALEFGKQPYFFQWSAETHKLEKVYSDETQKSQKIHSVLLGELTLLSKEIEELCGMPQSILFTIQHDTFFLLGIYPVSWYAQEQRKKTLQQEATQIIPLETNFEEKEKEIAIGVTGEIEQDPVLFAALHNSTPPQAIQHISYGTTISSVAVQESSDPNDVNQLVASIDFSALLQETEPVQAVAQETISSSVLSPPFVQSKEVPQTTTEVLGEEETREEITDEAPVEEMNAFQKASGNIIIECFKEVKQCVDPSQWGTTPELMHLAVLVQNFSQKNIPPTPKQVKYALDIVEKMKQ